MEPTGSKRPIVYILGEGPGQKEDQTGTQFVGASGRVLRSKIPDDWLEHIRWNNCVRTRPPGNRDPSDIEIEACRPSIVEDVVKTKPRAIFGFGAVPLRWALGITGKIARITLWAGRYVPINVGGHVCWFFPMLHPAYILYSREKEPEQEFKFTLDLRRAFDLVEKLPDPVVHDVTRIADDVEIIDDDLDKVVDYINEAADEPLAGVDYETDALRPFNEGSILSAAVSTRTRTFSFPYQHPQSIWTDPQLDKLDIAWKHFINSQCKKIAHHLPFELEWSSDRFGKECLWKHWEDTESQGYILDERRGTLSLEFLCLQYFGFNLKEVSNIDRLNLAKTPLAEVLRYNGLDAKYHRLLFIAQRDRLKDEGLLDVYRHQVNRVPTVVHEQLKGIPINQTIVNKFEKQYKKLLIELQNKLDNLPEGKKFLTKFGRPYKATAPQDTAKMIRQIMGREVKSTDEKSIKEIKHPVTRLTIEYRKANKLLSTYVKPVKKGSPHVFSDGLLHPIINVTSTRTWRSCIRGGTKIMIPGGTKPIENIKVSDLVYTYDKNKKLTLRPVTNTWYNGHRSLVRVRWGSKGNREGYLDVTPDHRFRLLSGEYIRADELKEIGKKRRRSTLKSREAGSHVLALSREVVHEYNVLNITGRKSAQENRFVFQTTHGWLPEHVHHKDGNKLNDNPDNLEGLSKSEHHTLHAEKRFIPRKELMRALRHGNGVRLALRSLGCDFVTLKHNMEEHGIEYDGRTKNKVRPWQRKARGPYKGHTDYVSKSKYTNNHFIRSVKPIPGKHRVYDLEVEGSPCFIANEICVHNSGEDPNVQNWPKRAGKGIEVRSQVEVDDNHWIISFDFAGIQARNVAMESKDAALIEAFKHRYDIHTDWMECCIRLAPRWFQGDPKDKENVKEHRNRAKNEFVFPSFFGAQPPSIARSLGIDVRIAQKMQDLFWGKFPDIHAWQEGLKKSYRELGYVSGLTGFRRRAPITPNEIINSPIQSDESMIMFDAGERISRRGLAASMEIHDDWTYIWHKKHTEHNAEIVIEEMLKQNIPWTRCVPLGVEMSIGKNWSQLKPSGEFYSDMWKGDDPNRGNWSDGTGWIAVAKETK